MKAHAKAGIVAAGMYAFGDAVLFVFTFGDAALLPAAPAFYSCGRCDGSGI